MLNQDANTLNGAMGTLRNSIQDNAAAKMAKTILMLQKVTKQTITMLLIVLMVSLMQQAIQIWMLHAINQIATQVTSTKNALDGTHNLTQAKQTATNAIDGATNLNKAQKNA